MLAVGLGTPGWAQEDVLPEVHVRAAPAVGGPSLEETTSTGSRLGLTIRETPASVEVITGKEMRERGYSTTQEAVTRTTGMTSAATPGDGSTALSTRGFAGHGSVMQLYDGTRFYVGADTVTFPVDTWPLERIEVLRGPASVLYGEGAIGGVVNYVPKKPTFTAPRHEALLSYGSWNTWRAAIGSGGALGERFAYRVDGVVTGSDGYVDRGDYNYYVLATSLAWRPTDDLVVGLAVDASRYDPTRYWGTPLVNGAVDERLRRKNYNVREDDSAIRYEDLWTRLRAEWRATPDIFVRNELYRVKTDRHWRNLENYEFQPASGLVSRTGYLEIFHDQEQIGNRLDVAWGHRLFGFANRLVVGMDVNRIKFRHTNNSPFGGTTLVDPFNFDPGSFINLAGTLPKFETSTHQYAAFIEDQIALTDRLRLIAGVRQDWIDYERTELVAPATRFEQKFDPLGWRVGAVFDVADTLALYGQVAEGTDPVGSLITLSSTQRDFNLSRGRQYEAGIKQSFLGGRGEWTLAVYQITKTDLPTRDSQNPAQTIQIGKQSSRGIEVNVGVQPARGWTVDANFAVLNARFDDFTEVVGGQPVSRNGNLPPNVPEKVANLWVTYAFALGWTAGAGAQYVGKRAANNANSTFLPGYTAVDAFVTYRVTEAASLTLRGRNLTNGVYAIAPYNDGTQFVLGDPRAVEFEVRLAF